MTRADIANLCLWRLRQFGVNFGAAPQNTGQSFDPPYAINLLINQAYSEFIERTADNPIVALSCTFPSAAGAQSYALSPLPPQAGGAPNPAAVRVYEMTYAYQNGQEYSVPLVSTERFRRLSGSYTRRQSYYGPRPLAATQMFGRPQLDVLPGTATTGDTIRVTIAPDPVSSPPGVTAANGGQLVNDADVPLIPPAFHMALVEYVVAKACDAANKDAQRKVANDAFEGYIVRAGEYGAARGSGDPEMRVGGVFGGVAEPYFF